MTTRDAHAIVVGTDFAAPARNAVGRAIQIAAANAATLHVVHASRSLPRALSRALGTVDDRTASLALRAALDEARSEGVHARSHLVDAGATRGLSRVIRALRPALVVVGTHGRSTRDAFVGSTAERLAGSAHRPVLLVRRSATRAYRQVVIAADVDSALAEAVAAARLVAGEARRSVVHAYEGPFEYRLLLGGAGAAEMRIYRKKTRARARAKFSQVLQEAGVDESLLHLQHGPATRVLQRLDDHTLLVINRHRSFTRRVLLGSTTRFVIAHGRSDVLIV